MKIAVPYEWGCLTRELLVELNLLKKQKDFETLNILYVREQDGQLTVAYEFEPDIDELYEIIHNILKHYEKRMQAISFTKTSNIQGNIGGVCSAFW